MAGESVKRALKPNKACVPCRARKVKCDAVEGGLPCSSCTSRQCAESCVLPVRKLRTRKAINVLRSPNHISKQSQQPERISTSEPLDDRDQSQIEPDLLYLNILNDVVNETTESSPHHNTSNSPYYSRPEDNSTSRNCLWTKLPHLDDIDNEYLVKKGVFDLPPPHLLDVMIKTYFDKVYPFSPVIDRAVFIRGYQSGNCSLFLLHAILTPASLHAPADLLSSCGFASRSAAQESFFSKAKLIHDFSAEESSLLMLQGCIILCMVILDHPTDWDFGYWFHNSIRLATKLGIRNICIRDGRPHKILKLYRRIWWALYSIDIFHVFINARRSRLLENASEIKPRAEDDWEAEEVSGSPSGLLSAITPQQVASPVVHCELSLIFGKCFSVVRNKPQEDPRELMHPLDAWRKSLAAKMHVGEDTGTDIYFLNMQAMSYRFECILCRLIRRRWQQSQNEDWSEWAKKRLRSAMLELDTIAMRVLASGTLQEFPISFVTTINALLALHIESALESTETDLVRSMSRISISQIMLLLIQGKEIPALKRALPVFEEILGKTNLYLVPPNNLSRIPAGSQLQDNRITDASASPHTQVSAASSQSEQGENNLSLDVDFLGFDFLDEWHIRQLDFTSQY